MKLKDIVLEILNQEIVGGKEVAPDMGAATLIKYMKDVYDMDFERVNNKEYFFRRGNRTFNYTLKELKDLGAPIHLGGLYSRPDRQWKKFKRG